MESSKVQGSPLVISPPELIFPPPFNRVITNTLNIQNSISKPVSYKVKTTAPKRYIVRPNTGIIQPDQSVEIQVTLTGSKDKPDNLRARDKFLVQSIILSEEQAANVDLKELWGAAKEEDIIKHRLKAYFTKPTPPGSPQIGHNPQFTPTIPQSTITELNNSDDGSIEEMDSKKEDEKLFAEVDDSQTDLTEEIIHLRTENKQLSSKMATLIGDKEDLRNQVSNLRAKIQAYEREKEVTLRQRKSVQDNSTSVIMNTTKTQNEHLLAGRYIQLILVAILFFYLGRIL